MYGFISYDAETGAGECTFNSVFDGGGGPAEPPPAGAGTGNPSCGQCKSDLTTQTVYGAVGRRTAIVDRATTRAGNLRARLEGSLTP